MTLKKTSRLSLSYRYIINRKGVTLIYFLYTKSTLILDIYVSNLVMVAEMTSILDAYVGEVPLIPLKFMFLTQVKMICVMHRCWRITCCIKTNDSNFENLPETKTTSKLFTKEAKFEKAFWPQQSLVSATYAMHYAANEMCSYASR